VAVALARIHHRITTRQLDLARQQLQRPAIEGPQRQAPLRAAIEISDPLDPPG
jgi:hypothetical protein